MKKNLIENYETNGFSLMNFKSLEMGGLQGKEKNRLIKLDQKNLLDKTVFVKARKINFQPLKSNYEEEEEEKSNLYFETEDILTKKDVFD